MPHREFKKGIIEGPAPVKWAWAVAILLMLLILGLAGYGLFSLIIHLTS